jgi:hypothetical protein
MCNHLNLQILTHIFRIFTIIYLIMIINIMRGDNFVAHLDGLGGTPVCRGTPVAHDWNTVIPRFKSLICSSKTARKVKTHKTKINFPLFPEKRHGEQQLVCERKELV